MNLALRRCALLLLLFTASALAADDDWTRVADGVDYRNFTSESTSVHVARIDLTGNVRVIATPESQRRLRVSEFAKKNKALVAVNGDYFTAEFKPIGLIAGMCGVWKDTKDTTREGLVAVGDGRAQIVPQREVLEQPEPWMETIVSGWPMLVKKCTPLTSTELPGSDGFTRSPHPRTAAGVTKDGKTMYLVVAEGRREGVPGMTLSRLARFMAYELGVCSAMNLDGGGSSAMWIRDKIVNRPSDGFEREVANHLAVVSADDYAGCNDLNNLESPLQSPAAGNRHKR
jgi:exopolysaccharide biosynthesis protein